MAVLGTLPVSVPESASFGLGLLELVEEAFERAGSELRSGYDLRTARRSLNLLFAEWANRGFNMWTIEQSTETLASGSASYSLPSDTIDVMSAVIRTDDGDTEQNDIPVQRISAVEYARIPNKNLTGKPTLVWYQRTVSYPIATLWPVPNAAYKLVFWRLRRIEDIDTVDESPDVPFRFLPSLVAGLAYHLSMKIPEGFARSVQLKALYEEEWLNATYEDREKSPLRLVPRTRRI